MQWIPLQTTFCRAASDRASAEKECKALNGKLEDPVPTNRPTQVTGLPAAVLPVDPPQGAVHALPIAPLPPLVLGPPRVNIRTSNTPPQQGVHSPESGTQQWKKRRIYVNRSDPSGPHAGTAKKAQPKFKRRIQAKRPGKVNRNRVTRRGWGSSRAGSHRAAGGYKRSFGRTGRGNGRRH
jgi:hypothetical protein